MAFGPFGQLSVSSVTGSLEILSVSLPRRGTVLSVVSSRPYTRYGSYS